MMVFKGSPLRGITGSCHMIDILKGTPWLTISTERRADRISPVGIGAAACNLTHIMCKHLGSASPAFLTGRALRTPIKPKPVHTEPTRNAVCIITAAWRVAEVGIRARLVAVCRTPVGEKARGRRHVRHQSTERQRLTSEFSIPIRCGERIYSLRLVAGPELSTSDSPTGICRL